MKKPAKPTEASRFTQTFNRLSMRRNDLMSRMTTKKLLKHALVAMITPPMSWVDTMARKLHTYEGHPYLLTFPDSSIVFYEPNGEQCKSYEAVADISDEQFDCSHLFPSTHRSIPGRCMLKGVKETVIVPEQAFIADFPEQFAMLYQRRSWMKSEHVDHTDQAHEMAISDMSNWCPSFDYQEYEQRAILIKAMYGESDPDLNLMKQIVIEVAGLRSQTYRGEGA